MPGRRPVYGQIVDGKELKFDIAKAKSILVVNGRRTVLSMAEISIETLPSSMGSLLAHNPGFGKNMRLNNMPAI